MTRAEQAPSGSPQAAAGPDPDEPVGGVASGGGAEPGPPAIPIHRPGRVWRLAATGVAAAVLLAGTLWGQDRDFPFGPFRMYATRDDPNGVVRILAVQLIDPDGTVHDATNTAGAPRRAELEGRVEDLRNDPDLLRSLAPSYVAADPQASTLRVVWRLYKLKDGRAQPPTDQVIASVALDPGTR
jgi:hypothetical protein